MKHKGYEYAEEVIELYKSGLSLMSVGNKIAYRHKLGSMSGEVVKKILLDNNVKIRPKNRPGQMYFGYEKVDTHGFRIGRAKENK